MRDLDLYLIRDRRVDPEDVRILAELVVNRRLANGQTTAVRLKSRANPTLPIPARYQHLTGYGIHLSAPELPILSLGVLHSHADLPLNGLFDIDTINLRLPIDSRLGVDAFEIRFQTMDEANAFLAPRLDRRVEAGEEDIGDGVVLRCPLLLGRPSSRLVFYTTSDGFEHLCLLDGRPGSLVFPGVTLRETLDIVHADAEVVTGCFLDSGQTPRLSLRRGEGRVSVGNRHYLRWPTAEDPTFLWTPDRGRPTASVITVGDSLDSF
ncbi:MAG: hypothetical protein ACI8RZ_003112 [Myxococcota bacterium]|jgi:hypothetical protein